MSQNTAASSPRFHKPADNHRPYHSHRFEVWSPKLRRRITFFRELSLEVWTLLEADPAVLVFCERPIVVKGEKRNTVVDFWVQRTDREEILILPRTTKGKVSKSSSADPIDPHLSAWSKSNEIIAREIPLDEIRANRTLITNWKTILHYLAANLTLIQPGDSLRIRQLIPTGKEISLADIQLKCSDDDPILLRTAVFDLLQKGVVRSDDLRTAVLNPSTRFTAG